ncbi:MAG: SAM-dependent methyltransferase [Chloroflexota bacterium]
MADQLPAGLGWTALLVARARATESRRSDRLFDDPLARDFVAAAGQALPDAEHAALPSLTHTDVDRWRTDYVAIRTRFCDDYLIEACVTGCRQVALLAAGLDTRAFRLPWPQGVRLFEVDLPDVFSFKERVLAERGLAPACQRVVAPADLREDWPAALRSAGFRVAEPTAWLVEGLLMYLMEKERDRLLDRVGELSSPGSRLALDHRPGFFASPATSLPSGGDGESSSAARFALLAQSASTDASLIEPAAWLDRHGWQAKTKQPEELFATYRRSLPAPLQPASAGSAQSWLATAERG